MKLRRAVISGGYNAGKRTLGPLADALCGRFGFEDADIFEFPDTIKDPRKLERTSRGQAVFVHSAGLLAVTECRGMGEVWALNSPIPRGKLRAFGAAAIKTGHLYIRAITGPHRQGTARVLADNAVQTWLHLPTYFRHIPDVMAFSTPDELDRMWAAGVATARIDTEGCEFFGPHELHGWDGRSAVIKGVHDEPLIDPAGFVAQLPDEPRPGRVLRPRV